MQPTRFVLDASVTLSLAFPDEHDPIALRAEELLESGAASAIVPALWWFEVRNILVGSERRGRITPVGTAIFLNEIAALSIEIDSIRDDRILLDLARQNKLSIYDAAYLALAMSEQIPLATLDSALKAAASAVGVAVLA